MKNSRFNLQEINIIRILFILSLLITSTICKGSDQNNFKRYDSKSAIIHYKYTTSGTTLGSTIKGSGTEDLYFKNWGAIELVENKSTQTTNTNILGTKKTETSTLHTINKIDNGENYQVDFKRKTITLSRIASIDLMQQSKTDTRDTGKTILENMGGKKIGTETILGYACEIWDIFGAKQWMHKGVTLKMETTILGIKTIKVATSAKFNISVADTHFTLPDFPIQETEGFMNKEEFEDETIEMEINMEKLSKMTFTEWKNKIVPHSDDLKTMNDEELHQTYDMIQKMIQMKMER